MNFILVCVRLINMKYGFILHEIAFITLDEQRNKDAKNC